MRIYVAHSKKIDYKREIYQPLRECSLLKNHELILPHEFESNNCHVRTFYKSLDLFIAEISDPTMGVGIELAFAFDDHIPIYCLYKKGTRIKNSVRSLTNQFFVYQDSEELVEIVRTIVLENHHRILKKRKNECITRKR